MKRGSFSGVMRQEDLHRLIRRMYPNVRPEFCKIFSSTDKKEVQISDLLDVVNGKDFLQMQIALVEGSTRIVSLKHLSPRIISPRMHIPEIKRFRIFECPTTGLEEILNHPDPVIILLKLLDTTRTAQIIQPLEQELTKHTVFDGTVERCQQQNFETEDSKPVILVQQVDNASQECVYIYSGGLLQSSLEANKNTVENLRRFFVAQRQTSTDAGKVEFRLTNPDEDDRGDHVEAGMFRETLQQMCELGLVDEEISDLIRNTYNIKPAFIKFIFQDYASGVVNIESLR